MSIYTAMLDHAMQKRLLSWCRQAVRFILPAECLSCRRNLGADPIPFFCTDCWQTIHPLRQPSCARCDQPFVSTAATSYSPGHLCQSCQERPPAFERAWTLYPYLSPLQEAICAFKYRGKSRLGAPLARLMVHALPPALDVDLIIPVPLHPSRLRAREFNQSLLLADQISRHLARPVAATSLVRVLATDPQTTLSRHERLRNLRQAFAVRAAEQIVDRRVLLIDDVYTTGTTLNECAKTLRKAGSGPVYAITLARTVGAELVPDRLFDERAPQPLPALEM